VYSNTSIKDMMINYSVFKLFKVLVCFTSRNLDYIGTVINLTWNIEDGYNERGQDGCKRPLGSEMTT